MRITFDHNMEHMKS